MPWLCEHYHRKCWVYAECCKKNFECRECHDKGGCGKVLKFRDVVCGECGWKGKAGRACGGCEVEFAKEYCETCQVWDDVGRHCAPCGFCVKPGMKHCEKCARCAPESGHICPADVPEGSECFRCAEVFSNLTSDTISKSLCGNLLYHTKCLELIEPHHPHGCPVLGRNPEFFEEEEGGGFEVAKRNIHEGDVSGFYLDFAPHVDKKITMSMQCETGGVVKNTSDKAEVGSWKVEKGKLVLKNVTKKSFTFKAATNVIPPHPSDLTMVDVAGDAVLTVRPELKSGQKVKRNPKYWQWDTQDGGPGNLGTIENAHAKTKAGCWISVIWDKVKSSNSYRYGIENAIDFLLVDAEKPPIVKKSTHHHRGKTTMMAHYVTHDGAAYAILGDVPLKAAASDVPAESIMAPSGWEPAEVSSDLKKHLSHAGAWDKFDIVDKHGTLKGKSTGSVSVTRSGRYWKVGKKGCGLVMKCVKGLEWVTAAGEGGRPIRIGDTVRVMESCKKPKFGWGSVKHGHMGVVVSCSSDTKCSVYFSSASSWSAAVDEMELQTIPTKGTVATEEPDRTEFVESFREAELCPACCERSSRMSAECSNGRHLYEPLRYLNKKDDTVHTSTPLTCKIVDGRVTEAEGDLAPFRGRLLTTVNGNDVSEKSNSELLKTTEKQKITLGFEPAEPPMTCATCAVSLTRNDIPGIFCCSCPDMYFCSWCVVSANRQITTNGEGNLEAYRTGTSPPCIAPGDIYWHERHGKCVALRSTATLAEVECLGKPVQRRLEVLKKTHGGVNLAVPWARLVVFPPEEYTAMMMGSGGVTRGQAQFDVTIDSTAETSDLLVGFTSEDLALPDNHTTGTHPTPSCLFDCNTGSVHVDGKLTTLGLPKPLVGSMISCCVDFDAGVVYFVVNGKSTGGVAMCIALNNSRVAIPFAMGKNTIIADALKTNQDPKTTWVHRSWLWYASGPYHTGAVVAVKGSKPGDVPTQATVIIPPLENRIIVRTSKGCLEEIYMNGSAGVKVCPLYELDNNGKPKVIEAPDGRLVAVTESGARYCGAPYAKSITHPGIQGTAHCTPYYRREPCEKCRGDATFTYQEPILYFKKESGAVRRGLYLMGKTVVDWENGRVVEDGVVFKAGFMYEIGDKVARCDAVRCVADTTSCEAVTSRRMVKGVKYYEIPPGWVAEKDLRPAFSAYIVKRSEGVFSWLDKKSSLYYCGAEGCMPDTTQCGSCTALYDPTKFPGIGVSREVAAEEVEPTWSCSACTFENKMDDLKCEVCLTEKSWACAVCTYVNVRSELKCGMCGGKKPSEKPVSKITSDTPVYVKYNKAQAVVVSKKTEGKYCGKYLIKYKDGSTYHCGARELKVIVKKKEKVEIDDGNKVPAAVGDFVVVIATGGRGAVTAIDTEKATAEVQVFDEAVRSYNESELRSTPQLKMLSQAVILRKGAFTGLIGTICRYTPNMEEPYLAATSKGFAVCRRSDLVPRLRSKTTLTSPSTYQVGDLVNIAESPGQAVKPAVILSPPLHSPPRITVTILSSGLNKTIGYHLIQPTNDFLTQADGFSTAVGNVTMLQRVIGERCGVGSRVAPPGVVEVSKLWAKGESRFSFGWGGGRLKKQNSVKLSGKTIPLDLSVFIMGWCDSNASCALARCSSIWSMVHRNHYNVGTVDNADIEQSISQKRKVIELQLTCEELNATSEPDLATIAESVESMWIEATSSEADNLAIRSLLGGASVPWESREPGSALEKINNGSLERTKEESTAMTKLIGDSLKRQCERHNPTDPYGFILAHLRSIEEQEEVTYLNEARYDLIRKKSQSFTLLKSTDGAVEGFAGPMGWYTATDMVKPGMVVREKGGVVEGIVTEVKEKTSDLPASVKVEGDEKGLKHWEVKIPRSRYDCTPVARRFRKLENLCLENFTNGSRKVSPIDERVFQNSPNLTSLRLVNVTLNTHEITSLCASIAASKITTFRVDNAADHFQLKTFLDVDNVYPLVMSLSFKQTKITPKEIELLSAKFSNVTDLRIISKCPTEKLVGYSTSISKFKKLKKIKLTHENENCKCFNNDAGWGEFFTNSAETLEVYDIPGSNPWHGVKCSNVTRLNCSATDSTVLPSLEGVLTKLVHFKVSDMPVTSEAMLTTLFKANKDLVTLDITVRPDSMRHITDAVISSIPKRGNLRILSLKGHNTPPKTYWMPFTSTSVRHLVMSNPSLTTLCVENSLLCEPGVEFISRYAKHLKTLTLLGCPLVQNLTRLRGVPQRQRRLSITVTMDVEYTEYDNNIGYVCE